MIYWFWVGGGREAGKLGGWNIMRVFTGDGIGNWVGGKGGEGNASVKLGVVLTCILVIGFFLPLTRWHCRLTILSEKI